MSLALSGRGSITTVASKLFKMDASQTYHLTVVDYIVFAFTLVISLGIGVYYAFRGQKTTSEFIVASRSMKVVPLAISLMVSFESSIMMLGMPAEVYIYGFSYVLTMVGFCISQFLSGFIFVPFFRRQKVTSVFEYLEKRFQSTSVRLMGTTLGILSYMCYLGIVLYGPGIALEAVTDFPLWSSIIVVALGSAIYTTMGGMKAVVWTDVFQSCIMYSGMIAVFVKGCMTLGGFSKIWVIAHENRRLEFDFGVNPYTRHTVFNVLFSSILRGFGLVFNQSTVQRISSTRNMREAKILMFITSPLFCITTTFSIIIGLLAFAYFNTVQCDPLEAKLIRNPNQIMPLFVIHAFRHIPGMTGLFIASLFSASLSTLSSGLSSLSTVTWIDLIQPYMKNVSETRATLIAKAAVFFYGVLAICLAFFVSLIGGPLTQIASVLITTFSAPLTGLHLYATLCPWGKERGAIVGTILSCGLTLWMAYGSAFSPTRLKTPHLPPASMDNCIFDNDTLVNLNGSSYVLTTPLPIEKQEMHGLDKFYSLSYTLIGVVGIFAMIIIGTVIDLPSFDPKTVNTNNIVPLFDRICCCIPECVRKFFRCGLKFTKEHRNYEDYTEEDVCIDVKEKAFKSIARIDYPRHLEMTIYSVADPIKECPAYNDRDNDETETEPLATSSIYEDDIEQKTALLCSESEISATKLQPGSLGSREAVIGAELAVAADQELNRSDEEAIETAIASISHSVEEMENELKRIVVGDKPSERTLPLLSPESPPSPLPSPTILNADSVSDLALSDEEESNGVLL